MPPYDQNPKRGREIINGFPTVAAKIASDKDKTTTIYRRFDRLSARNLLYMQAELAELEAEQDAYDAADLNDGDLVTKQSQSDWNEFVKCAYDEDGNGVPNRPRERAKMDLAKRVKVKLKEYHEALALHKTLFNGTPPSNSTIKALRNWFFNNDVEKRGYSGVPQLRGLSQYTYDDPADLVALRVPAEQDRLSRFIQRYFGVLFLTSVPGESSAYICERKIGIAVAVINTLLAACLLFGSIVSLYLVKNSSTLLGMISGWTVLFAICVGLLTNARRSEIFAATAAYAAVLVVFVSGDLGRTEKCSCVKP